MPDTAQIKSIAKTENGGIAVVFTDGDGLVYNSLDDIKSMQDSMDNDMDMVKRLAICRGLAIDPSFTDTAAIGEKITLNLSDTIPLKVQN